MNVYLATAAGFSLFTALLHTFLGGREIARPLLDASDINDVAKYTNYYCWHLVTIALFAMAVSFAWTSMNPAAQALAVCWTAIATLFALWSIALVVWKEQSIVAMPQWGLFTAIAVLGLLGLF